jgi:hypothetical protein
VLQALQSGESRVIQVSLSPLPRPNATSPDGLALTASKRFCHASRYPRKLGEELMPCADNSFGSNVPGRHLTRAEASDGSLARQREHFRYRLESTLRRRRSCTIVSCLGVVVCGNGLCPKQVFRDQRRLTHRHDGVLASCWRRVLARPAMRLFLHCRSRFDIRFHRRNSVDMDQRSCTCEVCAPAGAGVVQQ